MERTVENIYNKILRDVQRYLAEYKALSKNTLQYTNSDGEVTEAVFDQPPTPEEIEGLLLFLNKEKIAQA